MNNDISKRYKYIDEKLLNEIMPPWLKRSIENMKRAWEYLDAGENYTLWDCDWCELNADINDAEVNHCITPEQAWFLREKYLRMERT